MAHSMIQGEACKYTEHLQGCWEQRLDLRCGGSHTYTCMIWLTCPGYVIHSNCWKPGKAIFIKSYLFIHGAIASVFMYIHKCCQGMDLHITNNANHCLHPHIHHTHSLNLFLSTFLISDSCFLLHLSHRTFLGTAGIIKTGRCQQWWNRNWERQERRGKQITGTHGAWCRCSKLRLWHSLWLHLWCLLG